MADQFSLDFHPESRSFLDLLQKNKLWGEFPDPITVESARSGLDAMAAFVKRSIVYDGKREEIFVPYEEVEGGIPVFVYTPTSVLSDASILIYFHGGGSALGSREQVDDTCKILSNQARCIVVNVEYRLAPEHKFPAQHNDGCAVAKWVLANRESIGGTKKSKVGVSGDSSGGYVAASVSQVVPGLDFQILIYPFLNVGPRDLPSHKEFKDGPLAQEDFLKWLVSLMVEKKEDLDDPRCNIFKNEKFDHLPPTLLIIAEFDLLRDDSYEYSKRLTAAGVQNEVYLAKGALHGFYIFPGHFVDLCRESYAKAVEFIGKIAQRP